jgi:hypothetical protein
VVFLPVWLDEHRIISMRYRWLDTMKLCSVRAVSHFATVSARALCLAGAWRAGAAEWPPARP